MRTFFLQKVHIQEDAQVAKLVDALFSGSSAARCAGSNPVLGTKKALIIIGYESLFYFTLSNNLTLSLLATPKVGTHMKNNAKKARSWWLSPA